MSPPSIERHFAATYADARARFLAACLAARARVRHYVHPLPGPAGELLATDMAWHGPADATRLVVTVSGTHGVEGFCGAGVQTALLADAPRLPDGIALVCVHAINPHGFAWLRRVTEDNVDLNRNFVDHDAGAYPANPGYDELASAIVPAAWDDATRAAAQATLDAYGAQHGLFALQAAISAGQWTHRAGVFYGGTAPTWSRRTAEAICVDEFARARHAALIDFHTGLGPYGHGEPISCQAPDGPGYARARAWFGDDVTNPARGDSSSADISGDMIRGLERAAPWLAWTSIALEFGVMPIADTLDALRADAWLAAHGDPDNAPARAIKQQIRSAFYGDTPAWKAKVWARGAEMVARAAAGLAAMDS